MVMLAAPVAVFADTDRDAEKSIEERRAHQEALREAKREDLQERLETVRESAAERLEVKRESLEDHRDDARKRLEERLRDHCDVVEARLTRVAADYDGARVRHLDAYAAISSRLKKLLEKLVERGYETQEVQNLLPEFDQKLAALRGEADRLHGELAETRTFACGEAQQTFVESLAEARAKHQLVRTQVADLRSYFKDILRPALARLKDQKPAV
jgi:hypothetical protein